MTRTLSYEMEIDFEQLRAQKLELLKALNDGVLSEKINGVIHLMDAIQDIAVDVHGEKPENVYLQSGE